MINIIGIIELECMNIMVGNLMEYGIGGNWWNMWGNEVERRR